MLPITPSQFDIVPRIIQRNYTPKPFGRTINKIVLHTYAGAGSDLYNWFNRENGNSSAHYSVLKNGTIYQYVDDKNISWHAIDNNEETIGIEHQDDGQPYDQVRTEELYKSSAYLVAKLSKQYGIPLVLILDRKLRKQPGIMPHYIAQGDGYPTACPAGLHVAKIVDYAKQIRAYWDKLEQDQQTNNNAEVETLKKTIATQDKEITALKVDMASLEMKYKGIITDKDREIADLNLKLNATDGTAQNIIEKMMQDNSEMDDVFTGIGEDLKKIAIGDKLIFEDNVNQANLLEMLERAKEYRDLIQRGFTAIYTTLDRIRDENISLKKENDELRTQQQYCLDHDNFIQEHFPKIWPYLILLIKWIVSWDRKKLIEDQAKKKTDEDVFE